MLGRNFENIEAFVGPISMIVIGGIIIAYIWRVITWRPSA
jgi:hypothetical protein